MDIALHLGAHCTDEDRLQKALLADAQMMTAKGVAVPPPAQARPAINKALQAGKGSILPGGPTRLAEDLLGGALAQRIVLSNEGFLGAYAKIVQDNTMYGLAGEKAAALRDLFAGHKVEFFLGIRNPATFVPALFRASTVEDFGAFLGGQDMGQMLWSPVIDRIRAACPDVPLTIWCNEDLPLIWPAILRAVTDVKEAHHADTMILREVMTEAGFRRLETYLHDNPTPTLATWRKVVTAFLGKYADESKLDEEIALPGWSQALIAAMTDLYERDLSQLRARDDVRFLAP
ncbi:hypothetical protein [Jannaschia sp. M317]|uniref:hypothetical protein n=1 Tax=Jannaschia sp. M317 TaxID=2867011 RepID=UPI0021A56C2D|nr:hypothetical protein [Jannaschia sp. M317]UWQ19272.1 hypothetical protein K3551_08390 [Jannaschia sp. M317]